MSSRAEPPPLEHQLNTLIDRCHTTTLGYDAAIDRWPDAEGAARLRSFKQEHIQVMRELGARVRDLGGNTHGATRRGRVTQTRRRVAFANLVGGKEALIDLLSHNERDLTAAYREALKRTRHLPVMRLRRLLEAGLAIQACHREWLDIDARAAPPPIQPSMPLAAPSGTIRRQAV